MTRRSNGFHTLSLLGISVILAAANAPRADADEARPMDNSQPTIREAMKINLDHALSLASEPSGSSIGSPPQSMLERPGDSVAAKANAVTNDASPSNPLRWNAQLGALQAGGAPLANEFTSSASGEDLLQRTAYNSPRLIHQVVDPIDNLPELDRDNDRDAKPAADRDAKPKAQGAAPSKASKKDEDNVLDSDSIYGEDRVPKADGDQFVLPSLVAPTTEQRQIGNGKTPRNLAMEQMTAIMPLPEGPDRFGFWTASNYNWQAANTFSHPLYFEDIMLERHGQECCEYVQPLVSGARFFTTLPALPYLMTVQRPCQHYHKLGHFRPGSPTPKLMQRPPWQCDAAVNQLGWLTGAILLFP